MMITRCLLRSWSSRPHVCVALITLLAFVRLSGLAEASTLTESQCSRYPCSMYRIQDIPDTGRIAAVRGWWYELPSERARYDIIKYVVRLTSRNSDGSIRAYVEVGIIDMPEAPEPYIFSNCYHCYDISEGYPPPDGWLEDGAIGPLSGMAEFSMSYDAQHGAWAWRINGDLVRMDVMTRMEAASRIEVGAQFYRWGDGQGAFWHNQVQVNYGDGWTTFTPSSDELVDTYYDHSYETFYLPDGSVSVVGRPAWHSSAGPERLEDTASRYSGGTSASLLMGHDVLYVSTGRRILSFVPSQLTSMSEADFASDAVRDMAMCDDRLVVVTDGGDMIVAEVLQAGALKRLATVNLGHRLGRVVCRGDLVYASGDSGSLYVMEIDDVMLPRQRMELSVPRGRILSAWLDDGVVLIGTEGASTERVLGEVYLIGTTDLDGLVIRDVISAAGSVSALSCMTVDECWVGDSVGGLYLVAVSEQGTLEMMAHRAVGAAISDAAALGMGRAIVVSDDAVMVARYSDGRIELEQQLVLDGGGQVVGSNDGGVFVVSKWGRLKRLQVSTYGALEGREVYQMAGGIRQVVERDGHIRGVVGRHVQAFSAGSVSAEVYDVAELPSSGVGMDMSSDVLAVATGLGGLYLAPWRSSGEAFVRVSGSGGVVDVAVGDGEIAAAAGQRGLLLFRKEASGLYAEVGHVEVPGLAQVVGRLADRVFVGTRYDGLHVVDVSVVARPNDLGRIGQEGNCLGVAYDDFTLYIAMWTGEVRRWSLRSPGMPRDDGGVGMSAPVFGVAGFGGRMAAVAIDGSVTAEETPLGRGEHSAAVRRMMRGMPESIVAYQGMWVVGTGPGGVALIDTRADVEVFLPVCRNQ